MRKTTYISALLAAVLTLAPSCRVLSSDEPEADIVREGYFVYMAVAGYVLDPTLKCLDLTLKVDRYLKADDQFEKYYVRGRLLNGSSVLVDEENSTVKISYSEEEDFEYPRAVVVYSDESILTPGAEWRCTMGGESVYVRCTDLNTWDVILETDYSDGYYGTVEQLRFSATVSDIGQLDLTEQTATDDQVCLTYALETSGRLVQTGTVDMQKTLTNVDFMTLEPTKATVVLYSAYVYDGSFSLHLDAYGPEQRNEDIKVTLSESRFNTRVTVDYMGERNYWIANRQ